MAEHTPLTEIGEADLTDAFRYLDVLRESGVTNMYAATPYVIRDCGMKRPVAIAVLSAWIRTFNREDVPAIRARAALAKATGETR